MLKLKVNKKDCVLCPKYPSNNIDVNITHCKGAYADIEIWERCKHFVFFDFINDSKCNYAFYVICRYDIDTESREQKLEKATKIIEDYVTNHFLDKEMDDYTSLAKEILVKMGII